MPNWQKDFFNKTIHRYSHLLEQFVDERIILFLERSPDLTILDYFIVPYLKNTIFKIRHNTISVLHSPITHCCADLTP